MKIHSRSSKKVSPPHADTAALISTILRTPTEDLPDVLSPIQLWKWPRSDLHSWIKVLNKFDAVLEDIIREYDIDKLQVNEFTPSTKKILYEILAFERLLLENSTNRKLFNSYDRLSSLLFTSDLDVLVADLQLLLRPAQQYSAQASMSHALNIPTARLQALAKRWPNIREHGIEFVDLASEKKREEVEKLPAEASEVNFAFYKKLSSEEKNQATSEGDVFAEGARKPISSSPTIVHLGPLAESPKTTIEILADTIESYSVPDEEKFELMCRIRVARALGKNRQEERVKLVVARLLAIAIFCLTQNEGLSQSTIFLYEPDLVAQVAEFLHLDRGIPTLVQTAAIAALDGMGRYRTKVQELLTAVNAGVNHGTLMTLFRRTVSDIGAPESSMPNSFVEALVSFITYIASHASGGNMVVGAGLIPLLIQVIENKAPTRLSVVSKAIQLVDNVVYGFPNAFQLFCNARGVDAVVRRIQYEVDLDLELSGENGTLAFPRAGVLKHTLRTLHRMMQTSGTSEGLRGLIDSSLITSIKKIINNRVLFGSSVLPIAINVMATFVHNEPTSLTVLQEAQLPEAFYKAVEENIEPSIEVVQAIINAIGALCLNQAGQQQLASKPTIVPSIFSIFTSERHLKVLSEKEHAALLGGAIDELVRHHPSLKDEVFTAIGSVLRRIEELGAEFVEEHDEENLYRLVVSSTADDESSMELSHASEVSQSESTAHQSEHTDVLSENENVKHDTHENLIVAYLDVLARFLEGLFQHTPHCRDFVTKTDGLDQLGRIIALPCIPYTYASSPGSDSLVQVLRAMADVAPTQSISRVLNQVRDSLEGTREFWATMDGTSKLLKYVDISTEEQLTDANTHFRKLVALHTRVTLLADIFSSASYAHGRSSLSLLSGLTGTDTSNVLPDLGALHRACIWENIVLKGSLSARGLNISQNQNSPVEMISPAGQPTELQNEDEESSQVPDPMGGPEQRKVKDSKKRDNPKERNARALKHIATQIPTSLTPFFQAVGKLPLQYTRRNPEAAQKKQALAISGQVADVAYKHLLWGGSDDKLASYAYWTVMMGLITVLLFEERTSQSNLHTMLLVAFRRAGGLETLLSICRRYSSAVDRIVQIKSTERSEHDKQELVHVFGGLKVAFHLLHSLVSSKPLIESAQTILLVTRDKKDSDPDYFEPQDFLVKMRLTILPFVRELWETNWLVEAPLSVCKSVIQTMLELMAGENEEPKGDSAQEGLTSPLPGSNITRHVGPDENCIRQLCDMGFPRSAAERALVRTRNNVSAAAEFLLAQPLAFPPEPEPEPEPEEVPLPASEAQVSDTSSGSGTELVDGSNPTTVDTEMIPQEEVTDPTVVGDKGKEPAAVNTKSSEQYRQELSEMRESLKEDVGRRALRLLDEHPSLIFDVKNAFIGPTGGYSTRTLPLILQDIKDFSPAAYEIHEQSLAIRCRLLALVLSEIGSLESRLSPNAPKELMDVLLALLLAHPSSEEPESPAVPKWLASLLLVVEFLLVSGDEPRTVSLPQEDEEVTAQEITNGPSYPVARQKIFDICLRLLRNMEIPRDELIAILRLLAYLTRDNGVANDFVKLNGLGSLLERFKSLSKDTNGCQSYVAIILRHIVEDQSALESIMQQEIRRWFSQPRTRISDVPNYVRNCGGMALRDPQTFVRVTESLCQLIQTHPSVQHISLKSSPSAEVEDRKAEVGKPSDQMMVDEPARVPIPSDTLENMVHCFISELMRIGKQAITGSTKVAAPDPDEIKENTHSSGHPPTSANDKPTPQEHDGRADYLYACFLMQCLTELLFSYNSCKAAFVTYSKKRVTTPAKDVSSKHKVLVLNFLLTELTSFGTPEPSPTAEGKRRVMLCNWAMSVIVALCVHVGDSHETKDLPGELISIRKLVLDALSRAIKDPPPSQSVDERYGHLLASADLCHRLLTVKVGGGANQKAQDDSSLHMAKLMLEKNYVSILTGALSEVDLNYPNVRSLVTAILRPVEHLSKVAIKMGRATEKSKDKEEDRLVGLSSERSDEEDNGEDMNREETPDLYRHSALGIYGGEMDDTNNYVHEDEMDEDEEEDEVDMEFGDEDTTGSENTSTDSGEEDPHGDELDIDATEEGWHDAGDDEDEAMNGGDEEDEEDDDVEHDGINDDEEEQEITWQDMTGAGAEHDNDQGEDLEEEDIIEGMPMVDEEEADEDGMISEEDEIPAEIGILEPADLVHADEDGTVNTWFGDLTTGRETQLFTGPPGPPMSGRRRAPNIGHELSIFGVHRGTVGESAENSVHPLLIDPTGNAGGPLTHSRVSHRRTNRGNQNAYTDLLQTIEDLVSGGALQLFQQLMSVGRGGPGELHIDLAPMGGHLVSGIDRNPIHRHGRATLFSSRPDRQVRLEPRVDIQDFGPLPTLLRWSEEAKMTHGKFFTERVNKFSNHVTLVLLPAARKAAKEAEMKAKEEQERLKESEAKATDSHEQGNPVQEAQSDSTQERPEVPETTEESAPDILGTRDSPDVEQDAIMEDVHHTPDAPTAGQEANGAMEGVREDHPTIAQSTSDPASLSQPDSVPPSGEGTSASPNEGDGEPTPGPAEPQRVTVTIHGNAVDITDTGIDPTFLEALPDDMREEVLNQHFRERRTARQEQPPESQISPEFLDALPPEIRAEILQQESSERARARRAAVERQSEAISTGPVDIDPASFLATLDPQLRQVVLMDQEDGFLQTLPSHMIAEAGVWHEGTHRRFTSSRGPATTPSGQQQQDTPRKAISHRDAIQLLDKNGLATLVRLLFFPQLPKKNLLLKIFVNLCENSKTRGELLNLLLNILQDGTGDLAAVDKSFAQLSFRSRSHPPTHVSHKSTPKSKLPSDAAGSSLSPWQLVAENVPNLVVQRSLEALTFIVSTNYSASRFFLTEHEVPSGLKRATSRKGKGKEKQLPQVHFPVVLLLALLDRKTLLRTPSMMDSLAGLLATVTRPLTSLKDAVKKGEIAPSTPPSAPGPITSEQHGSPEVAVVESGVEGEASNNAGDNPVPAVDAPPAEKSGVEEKAPILQPPLIPQSSLRLIVNILTVGECSGRTFQSTLALIQHLSFLLDARDTIATELKSRAQDLGHVIYKDLDELFAVLQQDDAGEEVPAAISAKFSPASSDQAKLLRILKTIDYMYSVKQTTSSSQSTPEQPASTVSDEEKVHNIYESFHFSSLWRRLGDCLATVEQKPDVEHTATVLLPLIESLMVVCKHVGSKPTPSRLLRGSVSPRSPSTARESMEDLFLTFTESHRKILNLMVRNNPSLMSGSFSLLVHNPRVLDFDNKRNYFYQQLRRRPHSREHHITLQLNVRRARVFEDSYQYLQRKTGDQIKYGKLSIRFYDEEGVDAGGVTREWFQILARQMFNPNYALFQPCAADKLTYQPNRASWVNPEHLSFFRFVGRVIGKAIFDNRLLDAHFARSLYRQLLGKPVDHRDVEWVDPEYYNSLIWILENDPTPLDLTFSTEADEFGVTKIVPLKENGVSIPVTQENKREFVQLSAQYRLTSSIKDQIESLLGGFYDIIPKDLVAIFNEQEVELLISGTPDIDIDEWRAATDYNGYTSSDPVIVWWWRALKSFNRDERAKVLSFATGTSRVPLGGFAELQGVQGVQKFSIHKAYGGSDRLPQAHTCFNQIDLPQYSSYEALRKQLLLAIIEGGEGFGFA